MNRGTSFRNPHARGHCPAFCLALALLAAAQVGCLVPGAWAFEVTCAPAPAGLAHWYAGEGTANDTVGGWLGSLQNGATFAPGKVGQAFQFDGADDYLDLGNGFNLQSFTLAMWVKAGAAQQPYADIIDNNHTDSRGWVVQYDNTGLGFHWGVAGIGGIGFNLIADQWQFLVITMDAATDSRLYLDGTLIASLPTGRPVTYDGSQFLRLSGWGGGGRHFNGSIDEFDIYDRALTGAEVQTLYAAGTAGKCLSCAPLPNGLAAWWPAEADGTAIELAAGNHGTLGSTVTFTNGRVGQAFQFVDDVNSFVTLPPSAIWMPTNNQLTLECWIKPDFSVLGDKLDTIISKRDGCGGFSYHFGVYKGHAQRHRAAKRAPAPHSWHAHGRRHASQLRLSQPNSHVRPHAIASRNRSDR